MKNLYFIILMSLIAVSTSKTYCFSARTHCYGLLYDNIGQQNQVLASVYESDWLYQVFGFENISFPSLDLGLRTYLNKKPDFIYKFSVLQSDQIIPISDTHPDGMLCPGDRYHSFWNSHFGSTVLNIDRTQFERLIVQWFQMRYGFGIDTRESCQENDFGFDCFLSAKLGISSMELGNYNFQNINNNSNHYAGVETGLKLNLDFSYKDDISFMPFIDYDFFKSKLVVNKVTYGVILFGYNDIISGSYNNWYHKFKLSLGIAANKFFIDNNTKEFFKTDIGVTYKLFNN